METKDEQFELCSQSLNKQQVQQREISCPPVDHYTSMAHFFLVSALPAVVVYSHEWHEKHGEFMLGANPQVQAIRIGMKTGSGLAFIFYSSLLL